MEHARHCVRPGCAGAATATLSYRYASRTAWIDDLSPEHEPSDYDLCAQHADALTVPMGWAREDRRSVARLPFPRSIAV